MEQERLNKLVKHFKKLNLNSIDFSILFIAHYKPSSITELQRMIGISYKNLLPHINHLEKNKLIKVLDHGKGKKKEITLASSKFNLQSFIISIIQVGIQMDDSIPKKEKEKYLKEMGIEINKSPT